MINLNDETAFVTGGGQGLGRGIALELAKAGANIVIADLNEDGAAQVAAEIKALGRKAAALKIDVTDEDSIKRCVAKALEQFPRIGILINNAGVVQRGFGEETATADFDFCYEVNVRGVWSVSRALIPHFKTHGAGKIVNISSVAGRKGHKLGPAYCASKAAVISMTQALADELGPSNINVNAICPGSIWTPMWEKIEGVLSGGDAVQQKKIFNANLDRVPLRRPQTPEDVGQAAAFLVSSLAKNITGQALNVDGGMIMS